MTEMDGMWFRCHLDIRELPFAGIRKTNLAIREDVAEQQYSGLYAKFIGSLLEAEKDVLNRPTKTSCTSV